MKKRHKLNMLEPGIRICTVCAILVAVALLFYIIGLKIIGIIFAAAAAFLFLLLLILVRIELYQDHRDYLKWKKSNPKE